MHISRLRCNRHLYVPRQMLCITHCQNGLLVDMEAKHESRQQRLQQSKCSGIRNIHLCTPADLLHP
jgi:hypothetical protein